MIASSYSEPTNRCWVVYRVDINRLYIVSDTGSYLAAGAPGTGSPVENSRCTLYPATSSVITNGDDVTVVFNVSFKNAFIGGPYNQFLRAQENTTLVWSSPDDHGNLTVEQSAGDPSTISVSPTNGSAVEGEAFTVTGVFAHDDGWQQLTRADLVIASTYAAGLDGCWVVYRPDINRLYIRSDSGTYLNAGIPGSSSFGQNSHCRLDASGTSISGNGTQLTVNFAVTPKAPLIGAHNLILRSQEMGTAEWSAPLDHGDLTVGAGSGPYADTVSPASGTIAANTPVTFTATFGHTEGWDSVVRGDLSIASTYGGPGCWVLYRVDINALYLISDNGSYVYAGAPGAGTTRENSRCRLIPSQSSVSNNGETSTVSFRVSFKSAFVGTYNLNVRAQEAGTFAWTTPVDAGDYTVTP